MKRVAILTINDYNNYGNRLQNLAAQEVIKSLGFQVETIRYNRFQKNQRNEFSVIKDKLANFISLSNQEKYISIKTRVNNQLNKNCYYKKIDAFKNFTNQHIVETNFIINIGNVPNELSEKYDFFVTGSDQVWNPTFGFGSEIDFLTFAPRKKRIAYAPSFGISSIPDLYINNFKSWIDEMGALSIREDAGAKIIKDLTRQNASVLIDPTLMLTKEDWLSISKPHNKKPKKRFLLTYFLGGLSAENYKKVVDIAVENNLEIVNLANVKNKDVYTADPAEFIDYINSSSILLTDSFHGCVFSILLERPFVVFDRKGSIASMSSRIDTLLSKFQLESRKWDRIKKNNDIFKIDYSHIPAILYSEREKTLTFLREALEIDK
jgi:hypothetical protein